MELTQLSCFLAVAREGNFTRAAKSCNLSQPSLSYQISKLEEELGDSLFIRKARGVELSESGRLLLGNALKIQEEKETIVSNFRGREKLHTGEIRFGIIPTIAPYLLPPLLQKFHLDFPKIRLSVRESRTTQLVKEVVDGELEFAIVSDVAQPLLKKYSLHLSKLFEEALLLAVPKAHPFCAKPELHPDRINPSDLILLSEGNCLRDQSVQLCNHLNTTSSLSCEQLPTQLSLVAAGLGVAIIPEMAIKKSPPSDVDLIRFKTSDSAKRFIGILKKRGGKLSPAAAEFTKRITR